MKTTETVGIGMSAADAILTHSGGNNVLAPVARIMLTCGEHDLVLGPNARIAVDATLL